MIITPKQLEFIKSNHQTPVYMYSESLIKKFSSDFLNFDNAYGLTVRYAMKANSNRTILQLFHKYGLHIDASSEYEAERALLAGIPAKNIQISAQEFPSNLDLLNSEVFFVATSLHQLREFVKHSNKKEVGIRINIGIGSADFAKINTGGPASSFGIWYEYLPEIQKISQEFGLKITKLHIHIGSENDSSIRAKATEFVLGIAEQFPEINTINMGGGFKMAIMDYEKTVDLSIISKQIKSDFVSFYQKTGRELRLELEPGKYLMINSGFLLAKIQDIVDTGQNGYKFLKINSGMTEMPRVSLYGIQMPIQVLSDNLEKDNYAVVGHCCESTDLLTCKLYNSEIIETRELAVPKIGDLILISGVGAYNSSMAIKNYNSFPEAGELLIREDQSIVEIRKRQTLNQIIENEVSIDIS